MALGRIQAQKVQEQQAWSLPENRKALGDALGMDIIPGQESSVYEKAKSAGTKAVLQNAVKDIQPGPMDKIPPAGYIKSNIQPFIRGATQLLYEAPGRIMAHLASEQAKSAAMPAGQAALRDIVVRPANILKTVAGTIAGGLSETGKTVLEFAETYARAAAGQNLGRASLAAQEGIHGDETNKKMELALFGFNPKSYADYTEGIAKVLNNNKDATDTEKKFLPLLLPIGMLGADLAPGSPGRRAIVKAVVEASEVRDAALIARAIGIPEHDVMDVSRIFLGIKSDVDAEKYLAQLERTNKLYLASKSTKPPLGTAAELLESGKKPVGHIGAVQSVQQAPTDRPLPRREGLPAKAQLDWEDNHADRYAALMDDIGTAQQELKTARAADRPGIEANIKTLSEQGKKIEEDFLAKWRSGKEVEPGKRLAAAPKRVDMEQFKAPKLEVPPLTQMAADFGKTPDVPARPIERVVADAPKGVESLAAEAKKYANVEEFRQGLNKQTVNLPVSFLKKFTIPRNGRPHAETLLSIKSKGYDADYPVKLDIYPDGKAALVDGNGRVLAAEELGMESVPTYILTGGESSKAAKAYVGKTPWTPADFDLADFYKQATKTVEAAPGTKTPKASRINKKLEKMAAEAPTLEHFYRRAGVGQESIEATAKKKGFESAADFYEKHKSPISETDSYNAFDEEQSWQYALRGSLNEGEVTATDLRSVFASLKGLNVEDLDFKFVAKDLEETQQHYDLLRETLLDDPARGLTKYVSKTTGRLPEVTGTEIIKSLTGNGKDVPNSVFGRRGDDIVTELGFNSPEDAQEALESYIRLRDQVVDIYKHLREVRRDIRLQKQYGEFTEASKRALAREIAKDSKALKNLVEAAQRDGFRRGLTKGSERYSEMVARLKARRGQITAIQKVYNLTDVQMRTIRGPRDPRWMSKGEFDEYLKELDIKASGERDKNMEKLLIAHLINDKDLHKVENLQRAMELPPVKDMDLEQLRAFSQALEETAPGDTYLSPRMIQTATNTDLGAVRTIGEGIEAIGKQTGMKFEQAVEGAEKDRWLRDPTLAARDPLHKLFITEWAGREVEMLNRKSALQGEVNRLAKAARASRRRATNLPRPKLRDRVLGRVAPQDELVVKWLQPFETTYEDIIRDGKKTGSRKVVIPRPELRQIAERSMTAQELEYARFLEKMFTHYYSVAAQEATTRWTLLGVKHTNYKELYYAHMNRAFFERWKDDGLVKALKTVWSRDVAHAKVDFNAFGDRGEVLGYEKWLKQSMTREGEGVDKATGKLKYTQNTAKVAMAYFHAFERKLILDSMVPKIKLLEFLMGKRFQTPKSITNPEGTEQVGSMLRKHINEWINNKKGQRVKMFFEQGSPVEAAVDAGRMLIAVQQLGINLLAQVISGGGGDVITLAGAGVKGWARGHGRAMTATGRRLAKEYAGVIGEAPWRELGDAAHDVGDTLRSGLFYIFGDLAYRARRQMFLGMLTKEELTTGKIAAKRLGEIKLELGRWHAMPEQRSIAGSTFEVKAAGMYTEWAIPAMQNVYFNLIPKLRDMVRSSSPEKWATLAKSKEFQQLFRMVVGGSALAATAYLVLNPDQNDHSNMGYVRRKAAQEIGSTIQAVTLFGIPTPFSIMNGYIDNLRNAMTMLITLDRYTTAGPGHAEGDLKAPAAFAKAVVPRGIMQWMPEGETPLRTEKEIALEIKAQLDSGELTVQAAKEKLTKELANLTKQKQSRAFELEPKEYANDLKERLKAKTITTEDAKKELTAYVKQREERKPESFESDSDEGFIDKVKVYAEAIGTDPITAFDRIFHGQIIRRLDNGEIIVRRMSYEESQKVKKDRGAVEGLILDHTLPLQLGGTNEDDNLKLVPKAEWEKYTPVENYLGQALRDKRVKADEAQQLIRDFKDGKITEADIYQRL